MEEQDDSGTFLFAIIASSPQDRAEFIDDRLRIAVGPRDDPMWELLAKGGKLSGIGRIGRKPIKNVEAHSRFVTLGGGVLLRRHAE